MEDRNSNSSEEDSSSNDNVSIEAYYQPQPTLHLTIKNEINYLIYPVKFLCLYVIIIFYM